MSDVDFNYQELLERFALDENIPEPRKDLPMSATELEVCQYKIRDSLKKTQDSYMVIGECLKTIRDKQLYKSVAHSFEEYVPAYLGMSYRTAMRFIQISIFVSADVGNRSKYNFSQLDELASISQEDSALLEQITPDLSVSTIRKMKREYSRDKMLAIKAKMLSSVEPSKIVQEEPKQNCCEHEHQTETNTIVTHNTIEHEIKPLVLKNMSERQAFLDSYKTWPVLIHISYLSLTIYEYYLKNGVSILALEVTDKDNVVESKFELFSKDSRETFNFRNLSHFSLFFDSSSSIVDYLVKHKKEIE